MMDLTYLKQKHEELTASLVSAEILESLRFNVPIFDRLCKINMNIKSMLSIYSEIINDTKKLELENVYLSRMSSLSELHEACKYDYAQARAKYKSILIDYETDIDAGVITRDNDLYYKITKQLNLLDYEIKGSLVSNLTMEDITTPSEDSKWNERQEIQAITDLLNDPTVEYVVFNDPLVLEIVTKEVDFAQGLNGDTNA